MLVSGALHPEGHDHCSSVDRYTHASLCFTHNVFHNDLGHALLSPPAEAQPPSGISARSLASRLQSWCPTLGEVDDAIATELAAALLPTALASHGAAVQAARTAGADDRRRCSRRVSVVHRDALTGVMLGRDHHAIG